MTRIFVGFCLILTAGMTASPIFAETAEGSQATQSTWGTIGRFAGLFILVMAIIYVLLLSTKKIAAWIDKYKK